MLALSLAMLLLTGALQQADATPESSSNGKLVTGQSVDKASPAADSPQKMPDDPIAVRQLPKLSSDQKAASASSAGNSPQPIANPFSGPNADKKLAEMLARNEQHRQTAIHINEMAGSIHSEKDARALVDAIAEELTNHKHLMWAAVSVRHRVARAEYQAVADPSRLISDKSIADVWNEYVREIDAPEQALITQEEIHRMRWGRWRMSQIVWPQSNARSIWNMPNIHAVSESGTIADGGRPLEMLDILNSLYSQFPSVLFSRDRRREHGEASNPPVSLTQSSVQPSAHPVATIGLLHMPADPIRPAELRYQQEHGDSAYDHLVRRLFDELFPPE
jgi:hypothetical protein